MSKMTQNLEEYSNPAAYDEENDCYSEDVAFLQKWSEGREGICIDLACGTGRGAIPLAKSGHRVIGVDLHEGMLERAEAKGAGLGESLCWIHQDCSRLHLGVKSSFIYMIGNSFQHFITNEDQNGLLRSVSSHLEDSGIFVFETRFPQAEELLQPPEEEYWRSYTGKDGRQVDMYTISEYSQLTQIQTYTTIRRWKSQDGMNEEQRTKIRLRYVFPMEMERALEQNGLEPVHIFGDWKESCLTESSTEMIYVCRKSSR